MAEPTCELEQKILFSPEVLVLQILIPAIVLVIMHVYVALAKKRHELHPPYTSLQDNDKNRYLIAVAFGYMAFQILNVLLVLTVDNNLFNAKSGPIAFLGFFVTKIICAISVGCIHFPMFILINSPYTLLSSVLGVLFVPWHIILLGLKFDLRCSSEGLDGNAATTDMRNSKLEATAVTFVPSVIFLLILLVNFIRRIYLCWLNDCTELPMVARSVVRQYQVVHLKKLMQQQNQIGRQGQQSRLRRLRNAFKPWFHFPTEILLSVTVILVALYSFVYESVTRAKTYSGSGSEFLKRLFSIATPLTYIIYFVIIATFLYRVQEDFFAAYKGQSSLFTKDENNFNQCVYRNMLFPGYLIASMVYGFSTVMLAVAVCVLAILGVARMTLEGFEVLLQYFAVVFLVPYAFTLVQRMLVRFFLTDLQLSKQTINIRHMKAYHLISYFLIFFNVIMGVLGAIKRSLFAFLVTLLTLGRVDKTPMMFLKFLDSSHNAYVGFIRVQTTFKNPVMRCFCQILLEPHAGHISLLTVQDKTLSSRGHFKAEQEDLALDKPAGKKNARNRWYLAYTLLRNPQLKQFRRGMNFKLNNNTSSA